MRKHLHLSNIAAKLRSEAVEAPLDELPKEIRVLLEKLGERELVCERQEQSGSKPGSRAAG
jgi:hypothetical protein